MRLARPNETADGRRFCPSCPRFALSAALINSPLFRLLILGIASLLTSWGITACSSERGLVGRTYDNIVARDNAYFLAREQMRAVEEGLIKGRIDDYNRVLPLFPVLDTAAAAKLTPDLDAVIKNASLPIQHRPGSDYTDDAYLLIGKARYYELQYEDAVKTFKYVNTTSKDPNARHAALIWLLRTFTAAKEYESAAAVSSLLDKEEGTPANAKDLFLARAQYYLATDEPKKAVENLEKAIPLVEPKNERSRTRYILAQLYQAAGEDKKAYAELNQILKRNPPYELDFFSKLMLGQVSDLNQNDRSRLDKYFTKLLKDTKNKEYRDKIYYEMARLNYRQQRYPEALALLRKSVQATEKNKAQKAYTYLLAGRIYYDNLQRYPLAAAYYDSTVQNMPREVPEYTAIAERSAILQQFAQQLTTITTQDSLQALARLDPTTLTAKLTGYAEAELDARRRAAAEAEQLAARRARAESQLQTATGVSDARSGNVGTDPDLFASTSTGAAWYFDNPTSMSTARGDFIRVWGDRPLQDNWRTVTQISTSPVTNQGGNVPVTSAGLSSTVVGSPAADVAPADPAAQLEALVAQYLGTLPTTPALLQASQQQVEEALFLLGNIYYQQLHEPARGAETYEQLLTRFPQTKHAPETYYSLYLIYKDLKDEPKAEVYAQKLRGQFPNSSYARLVADPEYLRRVSVANEKMGVMLDSAFALYKRQKFPQAATLLAQARQQYPQTDLNDRVDFLGTLLTVRTQPPATAKAAVEKFYAAYPESPLASQASTMLAAYRAYEAGQIPGALASTQKPIVSAFRPGEVETRFRTGRAAVPVSTKPIEVYKPEGPPPAAAPPTSPAAAPTPGAPIPTAAPVPAVAGTPAPAGKAAEPAARSATTPPAAAGSSATAAATDPAAPAGTPYTAAGAAPHAVVLVFPKGAAPLATMPEQLTAYNNRFYRVKKLTVAPEALGNAQEMVVVQALPSVKEAQSYALKLRGPQSPLSKLRGEGYQTVVISIDNLPVLLQTKNLEEYQQFYENTYR